jgi:hypothetical protein
LDYLADKGLMAKNTAVARKAAAKKVLGVLSEDEAADVLSVDLSDVMRRFQNLEGKRYTPASLTTYQSRVRAALDDFESYIKNPLAFRPSLQTRERTSRVSVAKSGDNGASESGSAAKLQAARPLGPPSATSTILPIPIRADLIVHVQGLPYDLTEAEARKIANVILAMAAPKG